MLLYLAAHHLLTEVDVYPAAPATKQEEEGSNPVQEPSLGSLAVALQPCKLTYGEQTAKTREEV